ALCAGERRWTMSVPARPNDDPDLVIGDGLNAGRKAIQALVRERAEAKRELEHIKTVEFPRRVEKVAGDWQALRARAEAAEKALEEARADTERLRKLVRDADGHISWCRHRHGSMSKDPETREHQNGLLD